MRSTRVTAALKVRAAVAATVLAALLGAIPKAKTGPSARAVEAARNALKAEKPGVVAVVAAATMAAVAAAAIMVSSASFAHTRTTAPAEAGRVL